MKFILFIFTLSLLSYCSLHKKETSFDLDTMDGNTPDNEIRILDSWNITANKSYIEPYKENFTSINHRQLRSNTEENKPVDQWISADIVLSWYVHMDPGTYTIGIEAEMNTDELSLFDLSVSSIDSISILNKGHCLKVIGSGSPQIYSNNLNWIIPISGFYKIKLTPKTKSHKCFATIHQLIVKSDNGNVRTAKWLSSPSVYLNYSNADQTTADYEWLMGEVLVPKGYDPLYSFYMCLGFYRGYFGMQVNHEDERRILFSVWDSSDEIFKRDKVPLSDQVKLIARGEDVCAQSFEGEGTGGQSYCVFPWEADEAIQFLTNIKALPDSSVLLSAWFKPQIAKKWHYMATWKAPKEHRLFTGVYSFIDNFGVETGHQKRKAYYSNIWAKPKGKKPWLELNVARASHTDGDSDSRSDYGVGVDPNDPHRFFMWSGGYATPDFTKALNTEMTQIQPNIDIETIEKELNRVIGYNK